MRTQSEAKRLCLHCAEAERRPIVVKNYARHLQKEHNARYQELLPAGRKRMDHPVF